MTKWSRLEEYYGKVTSIVVLIVWGLVVALAVWALIGVWPLIE